LLREDVVGTAGRNIVAAEFNPASDPLLCAERGEPGPQIGLEPVKAL